MVTVGQPPQGHKTPTTSHLLDQELVDGMFHLGKRLSTSHNFKDPNTLAKIMTPFIFISSILR